MPSLGTAIRKLLKEYRLETPIIAGNAINIWSEAVGANVAKNSTAIRIKGKTLYVKAKNAAWRNEIALEKETILEEMNRRLGNNILEDIVIQ